MVYLFACDVVYCVYFYFAFPQHVCCQGLSSLELMVFLPAVFQVLEQDFSRLAGVWGGFSPTASHLAKVEKIIGKDQEPDHSEKEIADSKANAAIAAQGLSTGKQLQPAELNNPRSQCHIRH